LRGRVLERVQVGGPHGGRPERDGERDHPAHVSHGCHRSSFGGVMGHSDSRRSRSFGRTEWYSASGASRKFVTPGTPPTDPASVPAEATVAGERTTPSNTT